MAIISGKGFKKYAHIVNTPEYTKTRNILSIDFESQASRKKYKPINEGEVKVSIFIGYPRFDIDNLLKQLFDSLKGIAYKDDHQLAPAKIDFYRNAETGERVYNKQIMMVFEEFIWQEENLLNL